ncbi:EAL domain-containing protein [Bacillus shivajii]|uniref:sensor domain-containing protein n=1 Tax=Bacillus shivajii TaxID=1983719 RepID=UPI001CF9938D|nr:bifunctional diguanylate cyclase/phosphodiesterase [Bacillus shivajii]UCZ53956.1 EAL domain-containing protein [Bacillus shivajii]
MTKTPLFSDLNEDITDVLSKSSMILITNKDGTIMYVNDHLCKSLKYKRTQLIGQNINILYPTSYSHVFFKKIHITINKKNIWRGEMTLSTEDGNHFSLHTTVVPLINEERNIDQYISIGIDINNQYKSGHTLTRALDKLTQSHKELMDIKYALDESTIIAITDQKGVITYVNNTFCEISKYRRNELIGQNLRMLNSNYHSKQFFNDLWQTIGRGDIWRGEVRNLAKDGTYYWVYTTIVPFLNDDGKPYQYIAIRNDITERKQTEQSLKLILDKLTHSHQEMTDDNRSYHLPTNNYKEITVNGYPEITKLIHRFNEMVHTINDSRRKIEHQAYHDSLTGLPNRYKIEQKLEDAFQRSKEQQQSLALFFLDLDGFKMVNDLMGHHIGDLLLKEVSERLKNTVQSKGMIARQGGDEFLILLERATKKEAAQVATKILECLTIPFTFNNQDFYLTLSIGISLYPEGGQTIESMIKNADTAMYVAKDRGKNNYQFFTNEPSRQLNRKHQLATGLKHAIHNDEFVLYYQPQYNLKTGELRALEAFIRWKHPRLGFILPSEFLPLAKETGMTTEIGKWVLYEACQQNKRWQEAFNVAVPISINVSPIHLRNECFLGDIKDILTKTNMEAQYLEIEMTESELSDMTEEIEVLQMFKNIGGKVALDNFGTGSSSLSMLSRLPVDILKIDRSFIQDVHSNQRKAAIIQSIIDLGNRLSFNLVAEGVESVEQAEFLKQHNCHTGQGYYFAKPMTVEELEATFK